MGTCTSFGCSDVQCFQGDYLFGGEGEEVETDGAKEARLAPLYFLVS